VDQLAGSMILYVLIQCLPHLQLKQYPANFSQLPARWLKLAEDSAALNSKQMQQHKIEQRQRLVPGEP
jgi:hypothetical protein